MGSSRAPHLGLRSRTLHCLYCVAESNTAGVGLRAPFPTPTPTVDGDAHQRSYNLAPTRHPLQCAASRQNRARFPATHRLSRRVSFTSSYLIQDAAVRATPIRRSTPTRVTTRFRVLL